MHPLPVTLVHQRLAIQNSASFGVLQPERSLALVAAETPRSVWIRRFDDRGRALDSDPVLALVTLNHQVLGPDGRPQAGKLLGGDRYALVLRISEAVHYDLTVDVTVVRTLRAALQAGSVATG